MINLFDFCIAFIAKTEVLAKEDISVHEDQMTWIFLKLISAKHKGLQ